MPKFYQSRIDRTIPESGEYPDLPMLRAERRKGKISARNGWFPFLKDIV
jgi:hypothetical protein